MNRVALSIAMFCTFVFSTPISMHVLGKYEYQILYENTDYGAGTFDTFYESILVDSTRATATDTSSYFTRRLFHDKSHIDTIKSMHGRFINSQSMVAETGDGLLYQTRKQINLGDTFTILDAWMDSIHNGIPLETTMPVQLNVQSDSVLVGNQRQLLSGFNVYDSNGLLYPTTFTPIVSDSFGLIQLTIRTAYGHGIEHHTIKLLLLPGAIEGANTSHVISRYHCAINSALISQSGLCINYVLPKRSDISIRVYNIQGAFIRNIFISQQAEGQHQVHMQFSQLSKGFYLLEFRGGADIMKQRILNL